MKVTLATDGVIGANGGPRSPGTAYILLHHCMGGVAGHRGLWGFVRGGMGAVSEAIAASARSQRRRDPHERAGRRKCWCATAARTAWCWKAARRSKPRIVASNLDPKLTFLRLLEPNAIWTPSSSRAIRHFRIEGTSCKINLALNGLPEFTALSRRARAAAPRHHAHLPQHRIRGARLGRRQVRPPLASGRCSS